MTNHTPTSKLTPENAVILLVDHQVGLFVWWATRSGSPCRSRRSPNRRDV